LLRLYRLVLEQPAVPFELLMRLSKTALKHLTRAPVVAAKYEYLPCTVKLAKNCRPFGSLSHGERQRVELSMILASRPWLVLLDEPAAGLTAAEIATLGEIVTDISRDAAVVIVEHDMQFIRSIAGLVTVFAQGRILMEDQVDKVMADARVREVYLGRKN
jgi:ABC-type uncharacterized transport system ATPase subunit